MLGTPDGGNGACQSCQNQPLAREEAQQTPFLGTCRRNSWRTSDNLDVRTMIPHLSVYLGHLSKEETYWYLTATPDLLSAAGEAFRRSCEPGGDS